MWELGHREGWALKNWCLPIMVLEKTLESPSDSKEIKPVNPKGNQSWIFTSRTDAEAEVPIFWPPDVKSWLSRKTEGRRRRGWQRIWCLDGVTKSMDISLSKLREMVKDRKAWHAAIYGVTKNQTWLSNWTTTPLILFLSTASATSMLSNPLANSQFYLNILTSFSLLL